MTLGGAGVAIRQGLMSEDPSSSEKPAPSDLQRTVPAVPGRVDPSSAESAAVLSAVQYLVELLPLPQVLEGYNRAVPRLAARIVRMVEDEGRHRREMERFGQQHDSKVELRGHIFGFSIAIFSFVVAGILIALERPLYGLIPLVAAVGGLPGLFVWATSRSTPRAVEPPKRERTRL